jgi:hypothetical protein
MKLQNPNCIENISVSHNTNYMEVKFKAHLIRVHKKKEDIGTIENLNILDKYFLKKNTFHIRVYKSDIAVDLNYPYNILYNTYVINFQHFLIDRNNIFDNIFDNTFGINKNIDFPCRTLSNYLPTYSEYFVIGVITIILSSTVFRIFNNSIKSDLLKCCMASCLSHCIYAWLYYPMQIKKLILKIRNMFKNLLY